MGWLQRQPVLTSHQKFLFILHYKREIRLFVFKCLLFKRLTVWGTVKVSSLLNVWLFFFFLVKQVKCLLGGKRVHVHRHKGGLRESHTLVAVQITFMGYFCVTLTLKQVRWQILEKENYLFSRKDILLKTFVVFLCPLELRKTTEVTVLDSSPFKPASGVF